jgi:hypothetical protein
MRLYRYARLVSEAWVGKLNNARIRSVYHGRVAQVSHPFLNDIVIHLKYN